MLAFVIYAGWLSDEEIETVIVNRKRGPFLYK
jgi:hypothetical protein